MKKFAVLLTITALLILTAACGKNTVNNKTVSKPDNTDSEVTELFNEDETKKDKVYKEFERIVGEYYVDN